jgi:hypothetical protein
LQYDDGPLAVLKEVSEFEAYIVQNSSHSIQGRRLVRMSLRALEGQVVTWPYDHISVNLPVLPVALAYTLSLTANRFPLKLVLWGKTLQGNIINPLPNLCFTHQTSRRLSLERLAAWQWLRRGARVY